MMNQSVPGTTVIDTNSLGGQNIHPQFTGFANQGGNAGTQIPSEQPITVPPTGRVEVQPQPTMVIPDHDPSGSIVAPQPNMHALHAQVPHPTVKLTFPELPENLTDDQEILLRLQDSAKSSFRYGYDGLEQRTEPIKQMIKSATSTQDLLGDQILNALKSLPSRYRGTVRHYAEQIASGLSSIVDNHIDLEKAPKISEAAYALWTDIIKNHPNEEVVNAAIRSMVSFAEGKPKGSTYGRKLLAKHVTNARNLINKDLLVNNPAKVLAAVTQGNSDMYFADDALEQQVLNNIAVAAITHPQDSKAGLVALHEFAIQAKSNQSTDNRRSLETYQSAIQSSLASQPPGPSVPTENKDRAQEVLGVITDALSKMGSESLDQQNPPVIDANTALAPQPIHAAPGPAQMAPGQLTLVA